MIRRVPVTCGWRDQTMVGTMHEASHLAASGDRIALLLLNAGPAPRAGNSDLSAALADRLAARGIPGFRFDLPGLGDSTGASWPDIDTFWQASQRGHNDEAVITLVNDLCVRHRLRGVLFGGLCAGAIASVRVGEPLADRIAGLVLLEPNFRASADIRSTQLPPEAAGAASGGSPVVAVKPSRARRLRRTVKRLMSANEVLTILTGESRYARPFRPIRPLLERMLARRVGRELPPDALIGAVMAWRRLLEHRVPSLVVLAKGLGTDRYMDRLNRAFPPADADLLRIELIPETNHILTAGEARELTCGALESWVEDRFPRSIAPRADAAPSTAAIAPARA